jgi:hypothetical protein
MGSMHTRRPSYQINSPHADEMGGTASSSAAASTILGEPAARPTLLSTHDQGERDSQFSSTAVQSEPVSDSEDTREPLGAGDVLRPISTANHTEGQPGLDGSPHETSADAVAMLKKDGLTES